MEANKKFRDMSYQEFIKDVLKVELTEEQLIYLNMFLELKEEKGTFNRPYFEGIKTPGILPSYPTADTIKTTW